MTGSGDLRPPLKMLFLAPWIQAYCYQRLLLLILRVLYRVAQHDDYSRIVSEQVQSNAV